ncbi:metallopeptidase family protein [Boudabousia marimammalium]|uniref:Peptidase n=1 Tax=Boudabousia marimammalium TaxID=156892 RepID=A0A1Q5PS38_9ACTO|nr:metallopeptidase family protein [Boudabousia marimammalium]OKL50376.1 hypothetical protein BM477_02120 [Boudabousia marimammalium]
MPNLVWNTAVNYDESAGVGRRALLHHRRDRHGRAQRGPLLVPTVPGWKSIRDSFDDLSAKCLADLAQTFPPAQEVELCVEDVPPSDAAPWERNGVRLARCFDRDRRSGLKPRIVLYRLPITRRCSHQEALEELVRTLLVDALATLYAVSPEDVEGW